MDLPIYFISDIHLMLKRTKSEAKREEILFSFFDHVRKTGGTLIINGDLFDFYFEYKYVIPKVYSHFYYQILKLRESGVKVHYVLGNHDYWVMDFINDTLFDEVYDDDVKIKIGGKTFYITHGDGFLSWDKSYRALKSLIRSRLFIWFYRSLHPSIGYSFANWVSKKGEHYAHSDEYNKKILNEMRIQAKPYLDNGCDYFISGHYHQAKELDMKNGKLLILGDWLNFFSYAKFDGNDLKLCFWKKDEKD
ncbi:MAG: UDP-2,3-diacylglucosamine diphosphatase [Candidatus Neomarinimicrobiota bacterium]|nr:MAG: UDP-2,3-diacylglucosamine diphosphatase [bacterium]|tara:strand:+ start:167 stop:913 length:747 start_codon:yes stop_codon:yes gene_type:complete